MGNPGPNGGQRVNTANVVFEKGVRRRLTSAKPTPSPAVSQRPKFST